MSSGSQVVPCRLMDGRTDGQTDMTKLTVTFRNFAKLPNNITLQKTGCISIFNEGTYFAGYVKQTYTICINSTDLHASQYIKNNRK